MAVTSSAGQRSGMMLIWPCKCGKDSCHLGVTCVTGSSCWWDSAFLLSSLKTTVLEEKSSIEEYCVCVVWHKNLQTSLKIYKSSPFSSIKFSWFSEMRELSRPVSNSLTFYLENTLLPNIIKLQCKCNLMHFHETILTMINSQIPEKIYYSTVRVDSRSPSVT